jgi:bifunctional N-acetylglucosamine-1-phosphate-uridyltransferase/glucosamine-1-phosphate-acetyltransferase GlmU-like protein
MLLRILDGDLPFSRSRRRKMFTDIIIQKMRDKEAARMALIEKFGKKDPKTKKLVMDGNRYQLDKPEEFNKEYLILHNEEVVIDLPPSLDESIKLVKDIVVKTDITVKDAEIELVEEIIKAFETISETDVKPKGK